MAKNVINIAVLADTKKFAQGMGEASGTLGKLAKGAGLAAAAVGVAAVAIGTKAVKAASDLQQNMGALESVFKGSYGQMSRWASSAAGDLGLAKSEYAQLATVLGSQMKNMGVSTDALAGQTHKLIGLGADLSAQFGGSTSEAVSALSSLLRGERDPIERYGVSINEAAVKSQMAAMGLSGLSGEAEKNAKLQATLALLFKQTADAQGAFTRESTTLAGAQQRLNAGTENLLATFGTALLPAVTATTAAMGAFINAISQSEWFATFTAGLTEASNAFADFIFNIINGDVEFSFDGILTAVMNGVQSAADWISGGGLASIIAALTAGRQAMFDGAAQVFPAILDALMAAIPLIIGGVVSFVTQVVTFIASQGPMLLTGAITLFTGLVQGVVTVLPQVVESIVTAIPIIVAALVAAVPQLLEGAILLFTSLIDAVVQVVPMLVTAILGMLPQIIDSLVSMIPTIFDAAIELFTSLVEAIPKIIPPLVTAIINLLPKIINSVISMIPALISGALKLFMAIVQAIPKIVPQLITGVLNLLPTLVSSVIKMIPALIQGAFQLFKGIVTAIPKIIPQMVSALIKLAPKMVSTLIGLVPQLIGAGADLIGGLVRGLGNAAGRVTDKLLGIAKGAINAFKNFFGIKSPSRLMRGYGLNLVQGLSIGIARNAGLVDRAMAGLSNRVSGGFDATLNVPASYGGGQIGYQNGSPSIVINVNGGLDSGPAIGAAVARTLEEYIRSGGSVRFA